MKSTIASLESNSASQQQDISNLQNKMHSLLTKLNDEVAAKERLQTENARFTSEFAAMKSELERRREACAATRDELVILTLPFEIYQ
jgi:uncharacterized protein YdaT